MGYMGYENFDVVDDADEVREKGAAKHGKSVSGSCPNCWQARLVRGIDQKIRCTKCAWCVEERSFDNEFARYLAI